MDHPKPQKATNYSMSRQFSNASMRASWPCNCRTIPDTAKYRGTVTDTRSTRQTVGRSFARVMFFRAKQFSGSKHNIILEGFRILAQPLPMFFFSESSTTSPRLIPEPWSTGQAQTEDFTEVRRVGGNPGPWRIWGAWRMAETVWVTGAGDLEEASHGSLMK